jgi:hypothetical protein
VGSLLKADLRLRLESLLDANEKRSREKSTTKLQEIVEKMRLDGASKPSAVSLQSAAEKLERFRSLLSELENLSETSEGGLGPIG